METAQISTQEAAQAPQEAKRRPALHLPKKGKKWGKRLLIALLALAVIWWIFLRPQGDAQTAGAGQYTVEPVSLRDLTDAVAGSGAVRPVESYEVSALASGEILEAPFEVGDWIEKGDLLYQLDAGDAQTSLQQAQLSLRQAQMSYDELAGYLTPGPLRPVWSSRSTSSRGTWCPPGRPSPTSPTPPP